MATRSCLILVGLSALVCAVPEKKAPDYSWAHARDDWPGWWNVHQWYLDDEQRARESGNGIELIFWGDSITQCWRFGSQDEGLLAPPSSSSSSFSSAADGTEASDSVCAGAPVVWQRHFGSKYPTAKVFGIGGDRTFNLMYRLLHGEGPKGMKTRVGVLLIGTNDLGYALDKGEAEMDAVAPVAASHAVSIADFLTGLGVELVLMGVFQRGDWHQPPDVRFMQPSVYTPAVNLINKQLEEYAKGNPKAHYVYCGDRFLTDNGTRIDSRLLPDALHPSMEGFELFARCIEPLVDKLMHVSSSSSEKDEGEKQAAAAEQ